MASHNQSYATGADHDANDLRRRNVPTYSGNNGDIIQKPESSDYDKKAKKVRKISWLHQGVHYNKDRTVGINILT